MREAAASPGLTSSDTRKKKKNKRNKSSPTSSAGSLALDTRKGERAQKTSGNDVKWLGFNKKQKKKDKNFFSSLTFGSGSPPLDDGRVSTTQRNFK